MQIFFQTTSAFFSQFFASEVKYPNILKQAIQFKVFNSRMNQVKFVEGSL